MENLMYYAGLAERYYDAACPSYTQNGFEKNVLMETSTQKCIFVSSDVLPDWNELLFRCKRSHGITIVTQKGAVKKKADKKPLPRRYEGEIHNVVYDNGKEERMAYPPEMFNYDKVLSAKVSNMDEFMNATIHMCEDFYRPYEMLQQLEESFQSNSLKLPYAELYLPYSKDEAKGIELNFRFSHFEKYPSGLTIAYEFVGMVEPEVSPDSKEEEAMEF